MANGGGVGARVGGGRVARSDDRNHPRKKKIAGFPYECTELTRKNKCITITFGITVGLDDAYLFLTGL